MRPCVQGDPDLNEAIDAAIPHVLHVHARVGFDQGPQVSDPFAPEWSQVRVCCCRFAVAQDARFRVGHEWEHRLHGEFER